MGRPAERVMVAAAAWFVQFNIELGKTTDAVKAPMLAPPVPLKVKVPPLEGMKPVVPCRK